VSEGDVKSATADGAGRFAAYDIELEQALIGSFLVDNKTIARAAVALRIDDLYEPLHQQLYELILEYDQGGRPVTPLTIHAWAKHFSGLQAVGGMAYLITLSQAAPAMPPIEDYTRILVGHAMRRAAYDSCVEAIATLDTPAGAITALESVVATASDLSLRAELDDGSRDAGDAGYEFLRDVERQGDSDELFSCSTGLAAVNDIIGGLMPGNLYIVAGRPGMGKTTLGTNLARAAAEQGWSPDYWSIEMPGKQIAARLQADLDFEAALAQRRSPIQYSRLTQFRPNTGDLELAAAANRRLMDLGIQILDYDSVTAARIFSTTRARVRSTKKRKLPIIDHLGLIEPDERYRGRKVDELSQTTKLLKQMAKRLDIPVVVLVQLTRDVEKREDKRPQLADLRDSGSIEQDADVVMMVYRPLYYAQAAIKASKNDEIRAKAMADYDKAKGILEILVRKNRHGPTDDAVVHVAPECSAVRDTANGNEQISKNLALELRG
jgi:replicative DNA helicase